MNNGPRGIPLSSMLRELPVSDTKQLTFSSTKQNKNPSKKRLYKYFLLPLRKAALKQHRQLWETPTSTKPVMSQLWGSQPSCPVKGPSWGSLKTFQPHRKVVSPGIPSSLHLAASQPAHACTWTRLGGLYMALRKPVKSTNTECDPESPSKGW